jgi:transposase
LADATRLLSPTPGPATPPAERSEHPALGRQRLAAHSKKASDTQAHLVLIDETGLFLNPVVRRTWSVIGYTPVLDADGGHREKVSVIGGISVSPNSQRLGFYFATEPNGFYTAENVVIYLRDLLKHLRGKVIVVWDRGGNHKGPIIRQFLKKNRRLHLEMLPPWAPDHNPVEAVWSWLKYGELANFTPEGIPELDDAVVDRLIELKFNPELLRALWDRSKLPFPMKQV